MKLSVYRVFYRDYVNDVTIPSHQAESLLASRLAPLARELLQHADNFFGVLDGNDTILQLYLDDPGEDIVVELLRPDSRGCLRSVMRMDEALALLDGLPAEFAATLLPDAEWVE